MDGRIGSKQSFGRLWTAWVLLRWEFHCWRLMEICASFIRGGATTWEMGLSFWNDVLVLCYFLLFRAFMIGLLILRNKSAQYAGMPWHSYTIDYSRPSSMPSDDAL